MNLLGRLAQVASAEPARTAVLEEGRATTYGELLAAALAAGRMISGASSAETVGVFLPTSLGFSVSFFGILAAGRAVVPFNIMLPAPELVPVVRDSGCDLIIGTRHFEETLSKLPCRVVYMEDIAGDLRSMAAAGRPALPEDLPGGGDVAVVLYTSGTTGAPKGVELTHAGLLANCSGCRTAAGFTAGDVMMGMLPMFHSFALTVTMLLPLTTGGVFVPVRRFSPEAALDGIEVSRVTVLVAIPSMYRVMVKTLGSGRRPARPHDVSSVRVAISGGEALPADVKSGFESAFGVKLLEGYGLTEASPVVSLNPPDADRPGTVGRALPEVALRVAPDGEVCVRGPNVMRGYRNKPADTAAAVTPDGWLMTGDMGSLSGDGYLSITGRKKEMIIVGGENVWPAEVENVLSSHPAVFEAAVIGRSDERRGEIVAAYVVLREGAAATEKELKDWCRKRLAGYKVPRAVAFRASLPKGATGKVSRRALAEAESEK